jgi:hypothetical protein
MKHEEYFVESYEELIVGMKPRRTNKKRRIQKKWLKRYGQKPITEIKKCRKLDVTLDIILDFCSQYNYPLPDEMLNVIQSD